MLSFNKSSNDKSAGHLHGGLAWLFQLLRNGRGTGRSRSLSPVAITGSFLAPVETPMAVQSALAGAVPEKDLIEDHNTLGLAVTPHPEGTGLEPVTSPTGAHRTQSFGGVASCVTVSDFCRIALSMPDTEELNGMGYQNFRRGRKSFATIEGTMAVIRLTRDQQATFVATAPEVFAPDSSGWGRLGSTIIRLEVADEATVQVAVATAWSNVGEVGNASEFVDAANVENANKFAKLAEAGVVDKSNSVATVNTAEVVEIENVTVDGEPRDPLLTVFERLQMSWGR
jgi:hypothetical protein